MEVYLGTIMAFGFNYAPRNWAVCEGQILPINANQSLYSLLGTMYGGDGRTTFALPDFRGRASFAFGTASGSNITYTQGAKGGAENASVSTAQMPAHNHSMGVIAETPNASKPSGSLIATPDPTIYSDHAAPDATLKGSTITNTGGSQQHNNMQPYLVLNWCIALQGVFPPRN